MQASRSIRLLLFGLLLPAALFAQQQLPVMPEPAHATPGTGRFLLDDGFAFKSTGYTEPRLERAQLRFFDTLKRETGILRWPEPKQPLPEFVIQVAGASAPIQRPGEDESYRLEVSPSHVRLSAANPLGVLRGLQTFLQLVHATPDGFAVDSVSIEDGPRFPWRGLMIDSGRHFIPVEQIRQNLDAMEAVKLNVLHWHVSEDQGFRIESKVFPLLQQKGSDGMFYTQQQVREVVAYARDRGIRVYPEFEMPSHANSLYVGYPQLADGTGSYHLKRKFGEKWGRERKPSEDSSMDPTRESTYQFLDRLFGEMSGLFPDAYLHVGGDSEDAITEWATNPRIVGYMRDRGYKNAAALQVYFTSRLQSIVAKHRKTMIGWDEVLTPSTPKEVVIQSWRGLDSLAASTGSGHRGILSWGYYLDLNEPASRHYTVDPLDKPLTPEQQHNILGGETAMWTEYVSPETIDGRIWPRAAAVAERLWSPREVNDVDAMYVRLARLSEYLGSVGMPYEATREHMYQRLANAADDTPLKILADVVEPPRGFPREGTRAYDVYTPLNHLSDAIPAESDRGRRFVALAQHIAAGRASASDLEQARQWLMLWRDNDHELQPLLAQSALTAELQPVSVHLRDAAVIGLTALAHLQQHQPVSAAEQAEQTAQLQALKAPTAELTVVVVRGVETLVAAAAKR